MKGNSFIEVTSHRANKRKIHKFVHCRIKRKNNMSIVAFPMFVKNNLKTCETCQKYELLRKLSIRKLKAAFLNRFIP